jgi:hypothetical protein
LGLGFLSGDKEGISGLKVNWNAAGAKEGGGMARLTYILAMLVAATLAQAQPQGPEAIWTYVYDDGVNHSVTDIAPTSDGGVIIGLETDRERPDNDFCGGLIRLDQDGHQVWRNLYTDLYFPECNAVTQTLDGGFAVAGYAPTSSPAIMRTDSTSRVLWVRPITGASFLGRATSIIQLPNAGFAISTDEAVLIRTNSNADTLWTREYTSRLIAHGSHLARNNHGEFFLCCTLFGTGDRGTQVWLVKADSLGNEAWIETYSQSDDAWAQGVDTTADGGCIVVGIMQHEYFPVPEACPFALRLAANGDTMWFRVYEQLSGGFDRVRTLPDGSFLCFGRIDSSSLPFFNYCYLAKVLGNGDIEWEQVLESEYSRGDAALCLRRGGGAFIGGVQVTAATVVLPWVSRLEPVQSSPERGVEPRVSLALLSIYPNPFNSSTKIRFSLPRTERVSVRVFDLLGREVGLLQDGNAVAGEHTVTFDASPFASGVYLCRLQAGGFSRTQKMVLLK